jgi:hypothetical protein
LTATSLHSLRNLAAQNGFEPCLIIPAKGTLIVNISAKLFNRSGYPLFIKPYSIFKCKATKVDYIYNGRKTIKIETESTLVPVVQGKIDTMTVDATGEIIQRIYIKESMVAENSILVKAITPDGVEDLHEVYSFFDNEGLYDNKQFLIKYSSDIQFPLMVYVKGLNYGDSIEITYFTSVGEDGNMATKLLFETDDIVDNYGVAIDGNDDEIEIFNTSGFMFGSNGTDENALRAAIGFNHGAHLLFDITSYQQFLYRFSTILLQKIETSTVHKSIINLYIAKKCDLNVASDATFSTLREAYRRIVSNNVYMLSDVETASIDDIINEYEYGLTSHNIFEPTVNRYAIQILFNTSEDYDKHAGAVGSLLYKLFTPFFYNNAYILNLDDKMTDYMDENSVTFDYHIFSEELERYKIKVMTGEVTSSDSIDDSNYTKITSKVHLPILDGQFEVIDTAGEQLMKEIFLISEDIIISVKN